MSVFSYHTVRTASTGIYKEKGSRFLAFAHPVEGESEIKEKILHLKREYFDARHHCYAWILGPAGENFRAFDDGEPPHSAGDPILGQIRSKSLTNVLVMVLRYFGGVKLGVGGLINAYRSAANDALNASGIIEKEVCRRITLRYGYPSTAEIMRLVSEFELSILKQDFNEDCAIEGLIALRHRDAFINRVKLINALGGKIILGDGGIDPSA